MCILPCSQTLIIFFTIRIEGFASSWYFGNFTSILMYASSLCINEFIYDHAFAFIISSCCLYCLLLWRYRLFFFKYFNISDIWVLTWSSAKILFHVLESYHDKCKIIKGLFNSRLLKYLINNLATHLMYCQRVSIGFMMFNSFPSCFL